MKKIIILVFISVISLSSKSQLVWKYLVHSVDYKNYNDTNWFQGNNKDSALLLVVDFNKMRIDLYSTPSEDFTIVSTVHHVDTVGTGRRFHFKCVDNENRESEVYYTSYPLSDYLDKLMIEYKEISYLFYLDDYK
jgi:hypothetical protein